MTPQLPPQVVPQIRIPEGRAAGVYANGAGIWSTQADFNLDFLVSLPPQPGQDPQGQPVMVAPQELVARVRLPPTLVYQLMRSLAAQMDAYETQHGKIPDHQGPAFTTGPQPPPGTPGEEGGQDAD